MACPSCNIRRRHQVPRVHPWRGRTMPAKHREVRRLSRRRRNAPRLVQALSRLTGRQFRRPRSIHLKRRPSQHSRRAICLRKIWWTHLDSNQGPLACEASALTGLSYASTGEGDYRAVRAASQERGTSAILMSSKRTREHQENRIMGRLRQVSKAEATPEVRELYQQFFGDRDPVAEPGTATGTPGDYWTTFALVPDLLFQARNSLMALMQPGRKLPAKLRELAIVRTGIVGESKFEYSQHLKVARMVGVSEDKLAAIKSWATSDKFNDVERAVMQSTDEIVGRNLVEDETFAALKSHLADEQIFELFYVIGL